MAKKRSMAKTPVKKQTVGDPPPPTACDLGDNCALLQELLTMIAGAASGSMLIMGDDGHMTLVGPPAVNSVWSWNATTGQAYWEAV